MTSQSVTWYAGERRLRARRVFLAALAAMLLFSMLAPPTTSKAQAAVGGDRSIEVFYERDLVLIGGYPADTSVNIEVLRAGQPVGSVTGTTDSTGTLEINHTGENDCWNPPFTPDIQAGDEVRTTFQEAGAPVVDSTAVRDIAVDFDGIAFDDVGGTITVKGHVNSLENAPIDVNADIIEFRMNKNNRDNPWGDNADPGSRRDLRAQIAPTDIAPDGSFTHVFSGLAPEDVVDARDNGVAQGLEWAQTPADEAAPIPEITVFDEFEGVPPGCPPHEFPRDTGGVADNAVPNVHQALKGELPAPGVKEGRTLEVFHGIEFVGLSNYPQSADVRVDVVRDGVVTGSTTQKTSADGLLEINHVGGGQFPAGDCWNPAATPDIRPGDTVLTTVLDKSGNDSADVDSTVVRDVEIYTDQTQVVGNTIELYGHVRDLPNAQIDEANDVLELRLNANGFTWDQSNGGRKDLRAPVPATAIAPDGTFKHVFNVSATEANNASTLGFEQGIEWSPAVVEPANPTEITVFDGSDIEGVGCPPRLAADANAITSSSHPFINGANGSDLELKLGGLASLATSEVSVSIVQEQDGQRNVITTKPAQLNGKTWTVSIPMGELSGLNQGQFDAEAAFTGTAVGTEPAPISWSTASMMKDTEAPAAPSVAADSPQPGTYNVAQQIALSAEEGAKVYYTTDGSDPSDANNAARQLYSTPIEVGSTQTVKAVALDRAGNASSPVVGFAYTIVANDTQLSLDARPAAINYGSAGNINLSGKLVSEGAGVSGERVILERKPSGATNWGRVGLADTAADNAATAADESGNFSLAVPRPERNTEYRARFAGAEGLKASQATDTVNVRVQLSLTGLPGQGPGTQVQLGRVASITGAVQPAHGGQVTITVERKNAAGRFVQVATANRALKDSAYRYGYKAGQRGEYRMRVSYAGDADHLGRDSRYGYFNVVPRSR